MQTVTPNLRIDFSLLEQLILGKASDHNPYARFQWRDELHNFWKTYNQSGQRSSEAPPLFAYALENCFSGDSEDSSIDPILSSAKCSNQISLIDNIIKNVDISIQFKAPKVQTATRPQSRAEYQTPDVKRSVKLKKLPSISSAKDNGINGLLETEYSRPPTSAPSVSTTRSHHYRSEDVF